MNRLKEAREERGELKSKLDGLLAIPETRKWTEEERNEIKDIESNLDSLNDEISLLEKSEERKAEEARKKQENQPEKRTFEVKVTNDHLKTEEARNAKIFKMIQGHINGNKEVENEARQALVDGGHYDELLGEQRNFSTLTDSKGGVFIPTSVSNTVMDIAQEYGVIPRLSMNMGNILQNEVKVPQVLGKPTFSAVNQGSAISGSGFNLGGISLKALKWGTIIDWTNEVDESVGARIMPIIMRKIAEAFALAQDDSFFNGTGTEAYNGIKGINALDGVVDYVRTATAATGNVSYETLDADDFLLPVQNVAPGVRNGGIFVMHPNMEFIIRKLKDGQGMYIYGNPSDSQRVRTLWGYPVYFSEAFTYNSTTSSPVCAFYNPEYVAYATGRSLTATRLTEGTITNENGSSVNLATADAQALRVTGLFDIVMSSVTRTVNSTAYGAFSQLVTNAS